MSSTWPPGPLRWPVDPLTDGLIVCDRPRRTDAPLIARACQDEASTRWLPISQPYTEEHAQDFIGSRQAAADAGETLALAVRDAARDLIGMVGLHVSGCRDGEAEIGYWTAPWARGRGVAPRASRLLAHYAFATVQPTRIEFVVAVGNVASQRAAHKAGAVDEGVRRGALAVDGGRCDAWISALLPGDVTENPSYHS